MAHSRDFTVVIEQDEEGYFVAEVPELHGCYTQARSLDDLMDRVREAIKVCQEKDAQPRDLRFVGVQRVTV